MLESIADDVVKVPLSDLNIIRAALNSAYYHSTVVDLAEQYRRLSQRNTPSNLTKSLHSAFTLVAAYIDQAEEEPDEQPVPE